MKQSYTLFKKHALLLAIMLVAIAQGAWAQDEYKAYFGSSEGSTIELTATTGQTSFTRPSLTVNDQSNKSIRSKFAYRWYIEGQDQNITTDTDGKRITTDPVTGSTIQLLYGVIKIGNKYGDFTVSVHLIPVDNTLYKEKNVTFKVKVNAPTLSYNLTSSGKDLTSGASTLTINTFQKQKSQWDHTLEWSSVALPLPRVTITHDLNGTTYDDTEDFYITPSFAEGNKFKIDGTTFSSTAQDKNAEGILTITAKPKPEKISTYGNITKTFNVNVKSEPLSNGTKMTTTFKFPKQIEEHYRYYRYRKSNDEAWQWMNNPIAIQKPVISDSHGNDVTFAYNLTLGYYDNDNFVPSNEIGGQDVFYKYSDDPLDDYPAGGSIWDGGWHYKAYHNTQKMTDYGNFNRGFDEPSTRYPDDYIVAVKAEVKPEYSQVYQNEPTGMSDKITTPVEGMLYGKEKEEYKNQNVYTLHNNEYIYRNYKHAPKIKFTPDPNSSDIQMAQEITLTPSTRFIVEGVFPYELEYGSPVATDSLLYGGGKNGYDGFSYSFFVPDDMNFNLLSSEEQAKVKRHDPSVANKTYINVESGYQDNPDTSAKQTIYVLNDNGTIKEENGKPVTRIATGTRFFSKRSWGNDDVKVTFYGKGYIPMFYTIIPWNNHWDIGTAQLAKFHITDVEPTKLVITPTSILTNTNKMSAAPKIKVVDSFGNDVSEHFDITPTKANNDWWYSLATESENKYRVTLQQEGTCTINVNATKKDDDSKYKNPDDGSFNVKALGSNSSTDGSYEIIYDASEFGDNNLDDKYNEETKAYERNNSKMGKLHFTKEGTFHPATISYQEVPGINIMFGDASETDNYEIKKVGDRNYLVIGSFVPDENGNPSQGYITIEALTNGYLTIDAKFLKLGGSNTQRYILHDLTTKGKDNQFILYKEEKTGEAKFPLPLLAGHQYALYTDGVLTLHGINFDPAFIALSTDKEGWHSAVTFPNGYTGSLPKLRSGSTNTVKYYALDTKGNGGDISKVSGKEGYHVAIDESTGIINAINNTGDGSLKKTNSSEMDDRVTIVGSVLGEKKDGKQVEKRPHYNLFIGDMPTYVVPDGAIYDQGNRISTTNIPTRIWMTLGGWENTDQADFPYYKNNQIKEGNELSDGWKTAKMDSVGRDNMTVDNFNYHSTGLQNPVDEDVAGWNGTKTMKLRGDNKLINTNNTHDSKTFKVPVRGTYLKFEPEESGRLFVYVLQNGMTDISNDDGKKRADDSEDYFLRRRAMYIVDETGNNVDIDESNDSWGGLDKYLSESDDNFPGYNAPHKNYYTDGMLRCSWNFGSGLKFDDRSSTDKNGIKKDGKYSWKSAYQNTGKVSDTDQQTNLTEQGTADMEADEKTIKEWWTGARYDAKTDKVKGPLEVLKLKDGSFVVPTKGYVRYTFNVKAGKTYFMFTTGSKIGFCGFGFLPEGYTKGDNAAKWINAATPNDLNDTQTAFNDIIYNKLPKTNDNIYDSTPNKDGIVYGGNDIILRAKTQEAASDSYKNLKTTIGKRSFVNVKLYRTLRNKRWNGICLPFSVSEDQVKKLFGENSSIITFDSVRANRKGLNPATGKEEDQYRTVHFTRHVSQLIEAGRPYFIYPDVYGIDKGEPIGSKDGNDYYIEFKNVTFEDKEPMEVVNYNDMVADYNNAQTSEEKKIDIFTYKSKGIYDCQQIPYYSYFMKATDGDGYLSRLVPASANAKEPLLIGYNSYIYPYSEDAQGKELIKTDAASKAKVPTFWVSGAEVHGGEATGIDELIDDINVEQTSFVNGVYTIDGTKIRNKNSLNGLPAGIYIMNGKKYTVE